MNTYEMVYILPSALSEDKLKELTKKVEGFITEKQGEITKSETWGVKKMTYPIKKVFSGHYFLLNFRMDPQHALTLSQNLKLTDEVVRFLLLKLELKVEKKKKKKKGGQQGQQRYGGGGGGQRFQRPYQGRREQGPQNEPPREHTPAPVPVEPPKSV